MIRIALIFIQLNKVTVKTLEVLFYCLERNKKNLEILSATGTITSLLNMASSGDYILTFPAVIFVCKNKTAI